MAIGGAIGEHVWGHLRDVIFNKKFNVQLTDFSDYAGLLSVQGPESRGLLEELSGEDLSNKSFPFSTHQIITIAGHRLRALRLTFVGELGWELHIPAESCEDVYREVMRVGEKYGITNAGEFRRFGEEKYT